MPRGRCACHRVQQMRFCVIVPDPAPVVWPRPPPTASLFFQRCLAREAQAASEGSLEVVDGVRLFECSWDNIAVTHGSLSRFEALRSLLLRRADYDNMTPHHPPLPAGLRRGAAHPHAMLATCKC